MAADDLIVPVLADFLSFHGLKLLFETVNSLEEDLGHVLDHVFIVVNSFNATFKLAKEALEALKQHYPEFLMPQVIRQCTRFAQASQRGHAHLPLRPRQQGRGRRAEAHRRRAGAAAGLHRGQGRGAHAGQERLSHEFHSTSRRRSLEGHR